MSEKDKSKKGQDVAVSLPKLELPTISSLASQLPSVDFIDREKDSESDKEQYHHREFVSSFVSRTMPLRCEMDGDNAIAKMSNGVLEVTIPKAESAKR